MAVDRQTVDLSAYPDLVVFYLGMRVRRPRGMLRLFGLGPHIPKSWKEQPDGLLLHEDLIWSLIPPHAGMRQYWRDLDSLERWSHSEPHKLWWQQFLRDSGGTWPLARDLLHGRRHRGDLRRHEPTDRPGPLCPGAASARRNVLGAAQGAASRRRSSR